MNVTAFELKPSQSDLTTSLPDGQSDAARALRAARERVADLEQQIVAYEAAVATLMQAAAQNKLIKACEAALAWHETLDPASPRRLPKALVAMMREALDKAGRPLK